MEQKSTEQKTTTQKKKKVAATPTIGDKARPVITADEVGRIIDLGLGRGVDATDPSPWQHKSSFQVRRVTIDNIIGTEEGGSLQSYEREVSSVTSQQTNLKASVAIPQAPVNLGLEGEQSRSVSTTRKAIGKRVVNRTVSFASQFDDIPLSSSKSVDTQDAQKETLTPRVVYESPVEKRENTDELQHIFTFEERLSKWILERVIHRRDLSQRLDLDDKESPEVKLIKGVNPLEDISNYLNAVDREGAKQIVSDCADFVRHFRITHYVNSVTLGAAKYRILSETEYYNKVSVKGTFGFETIANLVASETFSKKTTSKASELREIGKIINENVERGTYDEAVIGIGILPLHQLVKLRFLHLALRKALLDYIEIQGDTSSGPYLISCGDENIYWRMNQRNGYSIEGTRELSRASLFFIIPTDDGDHPYEFLVGWQGDEHRDIRRISSTLSPGVAQTSPRMFRYLDAPVSILGRNSGPLRFKNDIDERHGRFSLHSRLVRRHAGPIDLREWILGKDLFFINCTRRTARIDGFIAMKRIREREEGNQPEFTTVCVPTVNYHNERNVFMLFKLISPSIREHDSSRTDIESPEDNELFDQFDEFVGDGAPKLDLKEIPLPGKGGANVGLEMKEITPVITSVQ